VVKLNKIYTRTGDDGKTVLGDGARVDKHDARVIAYGEVDEANAHLGVAIVEIERSGDARLTPLTEELTRVQNDLFDVGADLCVPLRADEDEGSRLRVHADQTKRLERAIDRLNADLSALTSFVLPGGSGVAAALHVSRTVTRRAERRVADLLSRDADRTNPETMTYLNRLSDLLFVMARYANAGASGDVLWKPGEHRDGGGGAEG
jgi:cob(I)alamin adenosyltransferase